MARERSAELTHSALMGRRAWAPLPAIAAFHGDAEFFKRELQDRFVKELGAEGGEPWVRRFSPVEKQPNAPTLAEVLDDLRTPSFFASKRLVIIDNADAFVAAHREALEPFLESGFGGGHLILSLENLDLRTRFAKAVAEKGWAVACSKPFDRPPPWQPDADPWESELCRWIGARARGKDLPLDPELAYAFLQRVGNDLATLDAEMEKLKSFLGGRKRVDLAAIEAVTGELREDSLFDLVDSFLAEDRARCLHMAGRLLRHGYHPPRGTPVMDHGAIWSMFVGALLGRLRSLRRAHALAAQGQGADAWVSLRLTPKPFLARFQRDLRSTPPERIEWIFRALRELDRSVKTGGDPQAALEEILASTRPSHRTGSASAG